MPKKSKTEKIEELLLFPNVFQEPEGLKGNWKKDIFENNSPIVVEVGAGRGEYTVGMAEMYPSKNFVAVEIKGPRLWRGAKNAMDKGLENAAFVRSLVERLPDYFEKDEVNEIWVTFPDPRPKPARALQRLISPRFVEIYRQVLKAGGLLHLKTDNTMMYEYALETFASDPGIKIVFSTVDLYGSGVKDDATEVKTYYEDLFTKQGETIKYIRAVID